MGRRRDRRLATMVTGMALLLVCGSPAVAGQLDCLQPESNGDMPLTSDALAILKAAVGQATGCDSDPCICDCTSDGTLLSSDALCALRYAVGATQDPLPCQCFPIDVGCSSFELESRAGSAMDIGWTGVGHGEPFPGGVQLGLEVGRKCSESGAECRSDADCAGAGFCAASCDCVGDTTCELTGPVHQHRCVDDLEPCDTNADCEEGVACNAPFGPPLPLSAGGTPLCVHPFFDGPVMGTLSADSGESSLSATLRFRVFQGIGIDRPCPRCGAPSADPKVGDAFVCDSGLKVGLACTVDAVTEDYGGVSFDCPSNLDGSISGSGLVVRLGSLTTGTVAKTAQLPCKFFGFTANPLVPGSNPKCLDRNEEGDPVCASNADCMRCTEDVAAACATNGDCAGKGLCAEAPDQPVTCGFWCSCGFCDGNPSLPCFESSECPEGQACQAGTGATNTASMPQQRPNDCSGDDFLCGGQTSEECATTEFSSCSLQPYRNCENDGDCESFDAGTCVFEPRSCFESRISRSGSPSAIAAWCSIEPKACSSNADCTQAGDECVAGSARPESVALFCLPPTTGSGRNSAYGITGPATLRLASLLKVCSCGDGAIGCSEECDDANVAGGDGCDERCQVE